MGMSDYELGYTPANLHKIMKDNKWRTCQVAKALGVGNSTVSNWKASLDKSSHRDMSSQKWRDLVNILQNEAD